RDGRLDRFGLSARAGRGQLPLQRCTKRAERELPLQRWGKHSVRSELSGWGIVRPTEPFRQQSVNLSVGAGAVILKLAADQLLKFGAVRFSAQALGQRIDCSDNRSLLVAGQ